ncbi:MAG: GNAT family N-acetyltransferase, partial [Bacteroidota bacterium]
FESYLLIRFKPIRNLSCYKGDLHVKQINKEVEIKQIENANFEELSQIGEIIPSWQNTKATITNLGANALCFLAYMEKELCGYIVLNKSNNRILQLAVKNEMRNKHIGSTLLQHVKNNISASVSIINVDSNFNSILNFLESNNLKKTITQEEMKLKIANA